MKIGLFVSYIISFATNIILSLITKETSKNFLKSFILINHAIINTFVLLSIYALLKAFQEILIVILK